MKHSKINGTLSKVYTVYRFNVHCGGWLFITRIWGIIDRGTIDTQKVMYGKKKKPQQWRRKALRKNTRGNIIIATRWQTICQDQDALMLRVVLHVHW